MQNLPRSLDAVRDRHTSTRSRTRAPRYPLGRAVSAGIGSKRLVRAKASERRGGKLHIVNPVVLLVEIRRFVGVPQADNSDYGRGGGKDRPIYPVSGKPYGLEKYKNRSNACWWHSASWTGL